MAKISPKVAPIRSAFQSKYPEIPLTSQKIWNSNQKVQLSFIQYWNICSLGEIQTTHILGALYIKPCIVLYYSSHNQFSQIVCMFFSVLTQSIIFMLDCQYCFGNNSTLMIGIPILFFYFSSICCHFFNKSFKIKMEATFFGSCKCFVKIF
jgi:hypothetical protein